MIREFKLLLYSQPDGQGSTDQSYGLPLSYTDHLTLLTVTAKFDDSAFIKLCVGVKKSNLLAGAIRPILNTIGADTIMPMINAPINACTTLPLLP